MPAGGGFVTPALGRLGHHALRHYDRCARCSLQPGKALRETPDDYGALLAKLGPGCAKGCVSPLDRSRCGTPKGERVPLDARRALQARS